MAVKPPEPRSGGLARWLPLVVLLSACAARAPAPPRVERFHRGPFSVESRDYVFVPPGAGSVRRLTTRVWFPRDDPGSHPLVVYSHGYLSARTGGAYLAEALASRGYVVAAPEHPRTSGWASCDRRADDVVNQPGDVRTVIDGMLGWSPSRRPFAGTADPQRIGVVGLSLGGMTATLAAYHPQLRDPRIAAAVSLAGPMTIFGPRFFAGATVPFLMVAGDADVIVDYRTNAPLVLERVPDATLVTLAGGSHAGFDDAAGIMPAALGNPDRIACWWLEPRLDMRRAADALAALGATADGIVVPDPMPRPCSEEPSRVAMEPERQHLVTTVVVAAFFESRFSPDVAARRAAAEYLARWLSVDFPEATARGFSAPGSASRPPHSRATGGAPTVHSRTRPARRAATGSMSR